MTRWWIVLNKNIEYIYSLLCKFAFAKIHICLIKYICHAIHFRNCLLKKVEIKFKKYTGSILGKILFPKN